MTAGFPVLRSARTVGGFVQLPPSPTIWGLDSEPKTDATVAPEREGRLVTSIWLKKRSILFRKGNLTQGTHRDTVTWFLCLCHIRQDRKSLGGKGYLLTRSLSLRAQDTRRESLQGRIIVLLLKPAIPPPGRGSSVSIRCCPDLLAAPCPTPSLWRAFRSRLGKRGERQVLSC